LKDFPQPGAPKEEQWKVVSDTTDYGQYRRVVNLEKDFQARRQRFLKGEAEPDEKFYAFRYLSTRKESMDLEDILEEIPLDQIHNFPSYCAHILTGQIIHNSYGAIMFRSGPV